MKNVLTSVERQGKNETICKSKAQGPRLTARELFDPHRKNFFDGRVVTKEDRSRADVKLRIKRYSLVSDSIRGPGRGGDQRSSTQSDDAGQRKGDRSFLVCDHTFCREFSRFRGSTFQGISDSTRLLLCYEVHGRLPPRSF